MRYGSYELHYMPLRLIDRRNDIAIHY